MEVIEGNPGVHWDENFNERIIAVSSKEIQEGPREGTPGAVNFHVLGQPKTFQTRHFQSFQLLNVSNGTVVVYGGKMDFIIKRSIHLNLAFSPYRNDESLSKRPAATSKDFKTIRTAEFLNPPKLLMLSKKSDETCLAAFKSEMRQNSAGDLNHRQKYT